MVRWNKTKIIGTIGPASSNRKELRLMVLSGLDIARINGAHGTSEEHKKTIDLVRAISNKERFPVGILFDLPGPKLRIGNLKREVVRVKRGQTLILNCGETNQKDSEIPIPHKKLCKWVSPKSKIYLNDGTIELRVVNIEGSKVECKAKSSGELRSRKGLNLPHAKLDIPSLTKKDKELLKFAIKQKVDYIALSFVRSAKNIVSLKKYIKKYKSDIQVIAKIEKPEALDDLDKIIEVSDGIMVARGDLGIEMSMDKIPSTQRMILQKCHAAGKPSITATQMLESMVSSLSPTRAETTDVANAVWEGSDAVMLSEETSIGINPSNAVKAMSKIAFQAEKNMTEFPPVEKKDILAFQAQAISSAAHLLAETLKAKAIVTPTRSGRTALFVSKKRPNTQILAPTENERVANRMSLYWGVRPIIMPHFDTVDELLKSAEKLALKSKLIKKGDVFVITSGLYGSKDDITRLVEVRQA